MSGALKRDEWETVRLGDEMKSMPRVLIPDVLYFQEGPGVRNTQYTLSGVKLLNVSNLHDGFVDLSTSNRYISEDEAYGRYSHFLVDEGDFIIASSGIKIESFDTKMGFIDKSHLPLCMNTSTIRFKVLDDSKLSIRYFMYYLKSDDFKKQLFHHITGSAQLNFGPSHLKKMTFPLPPIDIQRRIAETLDKVTELLTLRKTQLKKLDELVKARFVELFGDPVSNPMGWERVPLSVCVESIDNGKSFVCDSAAREGDWPAVLKLSAATYGFYRPEENKAVMDEKQFVEDAAVRVGDLLFTRKNTPELVGMCAYVYDTPSKLMMPDLIFRLNTTERCNKVFLWKLINHDLFRDCIQAIATGSAKSMSNISKERLLGLEINLPPIELQNQFAAFVEQTDKSKVIIQQNLDTLEILKESLMQEYFG